MKKKIKITALLLIVGFLVLVLRESIQSKIRSFSNLKLFSNEKILGQTNHMFEAADLKVGESISKACMACHSYEKSAAHKTGPNLFEVAGSKIARLKNYEYSEALKLHSEKYWTIDNLDKYLKNPERFAPGTKMHFLGLSDPQDRMDLILFLTKLN
jgi:cytochrome c